MTKLKRAIELYRSPAYEQFLKYKGYDFSFELNEDTDELQYRVSISTIIHRSSALFMGYWCGERNIDKVQHPATLVEKYKRFRDLPLERIPLMWDMLSKYCYLGRILCWRMENGV